MCHYSCSGGGVKPEVQISTEGFSQGRLSKLIKPDFVPVGGCQIKDPRDSYQQSKGHTHTPPYRIPYTRSASNPRTIRHLYGMPAPHRTAAIHRQAAPPPTEARTLTISLQVF